MTLSLPRICSITLRKLSGVTPTALKIFLVSPVSAKPNKTQSVDKNSSPAFCAYLSAKLSALTASGFKLTSPVGLAIVGASFIACSSFCLSSGNRAPACCNKLIFDGSSNKVDKI